MGKAPAFQFYASDFLIDTQTWTDEEVGCHLRLLAWSWVNRSGIPRDYPRMTRISPGAERCWQTIGPKWKEAEDGTLINERLERTRADSDKFRERQKEKSIKAIEARMKRPSFSASTGQPTGKPTDVPTGNPLEGEGEVVSKGRKEREPDPQFVAFWSAYPVKKSKGDAERAWSKLTATERPLCLPAITAQVRAMHFQGSDGNSYVPHPSTWLNGKRWEDEISKAPPPITKNTELTAVEAKHQLEAIRAQHGIAPGGFIESHLVPAHISKAMQRG